MPGRWPRLSTRASPRGAVSEAADGVSGEAPFPIQSPFEEVTLLLLLFIILLILAFGVLGAIKVAAWVLLIALALALVAGFVGRSAFSR